MKKLQTTQNAILRSILVIRMIGKVDLGKIYEKTIAKKVRLVARPLKLRYAGHVARDSGDK